MSKASEELGKGLECLMEDQFKEALKYLQSSIQSNGTNLEHDAAAWWMMNVSKYRREWEKVNYGNANLFSYDDENNGKAWSDVEIAAVLLSHNSKKINLYLAKFLGRSSESVRFQRRYACGDVLNSWSDESGDRYTRYTQTAHVKGRLGV